MPFEHFEQIAGHICFAASFAAITVVHFLINRCRAFRVSMKGVCWLRSMATIFGDRCATTVLWTCPRRSVQDWAFWMACLDLVLVLLHCLISAGALEHQRRTSQTSGCRIFQGQ